MSQDPDENNPVNALSLSLQDQINFIEYFKSLPEKPSSTVRFFHRGEYYSLHGEDAHFLADWGGLPLKFMGTEPKLGYTCVNKAKFETFVRELLLVKQYRVEVYTKPAPSSATNDWKLEYKGSPGNLSQFEEIIFESACIDFTNSVMGITVNSNRFIGVCNVNVTESLFQVCEFTDDDGFTQLESLLAQVSPRECILPQGDSFETVLLTRVLERNGILIDKQKKADFNAQDIMQDLNRLLFFHEDQKRDASIYKSTELKGSMEALSALIKFLNLTGDEKFFNQWVLTDLDFKRYVRIDNAALYALHIVPKQDVSVLNQNVESLTSFRYSSILGVLDYCVTPQGKRLLEQWLKQPLKDINAINERLEIVTCFVTKPEIRSQLAGDLVKITDLSNVSKKLLSKRGSLQDCYKVYSNISFIPPLVQLLNQSENKFVQAVLSDPLSEMMKDLEKFKVMIEEVLDMEGVDSGEFFIKPSFDESLQALSAKKEKITNRMKKLLDEVHDDLQVEEGKIKLDYMESSGHFFRIALKEDAILRNKKNYKTLSSAKGGIKFVNTPLVDLSERYAKIKEEYEEKQKEVVTEVFDVARSYSECLRNLNVLIATIDVLVSFATAALAGRIPYCKPKLHERGTGVLQLKQVRHPCIEMQDGIEYIPNDAVFNKDERMLQVITGPNMCGKSTYLRSVAVSIFLAHIGSLVPCESAEISVVDGIFARVGADDSQLKGMSTFMLEMVETTSIVKAATSDSFVVVDELGRGTSTYDGCGIAWAIAEYLANETKCFSLFATHYHEIPQMTKTFKNVINLHVSALVANHTITPLYQIEDGKCDHSFAISCAKMAGFPDDYIQFANTSIKKLEHHLGTKYLENIDYETRKRIIEEGEEELKNKRMKLKQLDVDNMTDEELQKIIQDTRNDMLSKNNLFIKGLID